jgi:hypothetical protein
VVQFGERGRRVQTKCEESWRKGGLLFSYLDPKEEANFLSHVWMCINYCESETVKFSSSQFYF